jgi:hypothetical protein
MLAGTETALLLLASATFNAFEEAALNETVQFVFPAAVNEVLAQDNASNAGGSATVVGDESEMETDFLTLPCVAVIVPVCSVLTFNAVAANLTLVAPAGTVTDAGTLIAAMLLDKRTSSPPDGAEMSVTTVQVSVPATSICAVSQLNPLICALLREPLPCNDTVASGIEGSVVTTLNWPVKSLLSFGVKWTLKLMVLPAARVAGSFPWPSTRNAVFESDSCEI